MKDKIINKKYNRECVTYTRVSTTEQAKHFSLDSQMNLLEKYAEEHNLKIIKRFEDKETASHAGRKQFFEMTEFLKTKKKYILLVEKTDRLSRNFEDAGKIERLVENNSCEVHFVRDRQIYDKYSTESTLIIFGLDVSKAKGFISTLRTETRKGMKERYLSGFYHNRAPIGYKYDETQFGKRNIVTNKDKIIVEDCFKLAGKEIYTQREITNLINRECSDNCG